jgi:hypothetical protein
LKKFNISKRKIINQLKENCEKIKDFSLINKIGVKRRK